jgi:hypothetical protein
MGKPLKMRAKHFESEEYRQYRQIIEFSLGLSELSSPVVKNKSIHQEFAGQNIHFQKLNGERNYGAGICRGKVDIF